MLVLSRKPGEQVRIGSDITIVVLEVSGNQVRIGFSAPPQVHILRQELYDRLSGDPFRENGETEESNHAAESLLQRS